MLFWVLAAIALVLVIGDLIQRYLNVTQIHKRGRLQNQKKAAADAVITGKKVMVAGFKRHRHYVYVVTFSDGTSYQDDCSRIDPKVGKGATYFDEEKAKEIEKKAEEAHQAGVKRDGSL